MFIILYERLVKDIKKPTILVHQAAACWHSKLSARMGQERHEEPANGLEKETRDPQTGKTSF
jgi:hypothetical protein